LAGKIDRFRRIARYYRQKKETEVVKLLEAQRERSSLEEKRDKLRELKRDYMENCAGILSGQVSTADLDKLEGGFEYLVDRIEKSGLELKKAAEIEKHQREKVIEADITRRVWEKLVNRKIREAAHRERIKNGKLMDDIALSGNRLGKEQR